MLIVIDWPTQKKKTCKTDVPLFGNNQRVYHTAYFYPRAILSPRPRVDPGLYSSHCTSTSTVNISHEHMTNVNRMMTYNYFSLVLLDPETF